MSVSKEHSHDKPERVKWPHMETHWQPQHFETPHRTVKKGENSRSHSWWWDSHISPKSSKWLQENLAEMDSKVNAMLKIIEEDADSFAKRAEMFYKRRPELLSLVEEFYRTYRALVERHTFLTKELRQNIAPALQAKLGVSYESPSIPPSDLLVKHGSDGFDLASLSSYSFPGALEFDDDSQSELSVKSSKGRVDEEAVSPPNSRVSFETREFEFKPWISSSEEEHLPPHHQNKELHGPVDASSSNELRKALQLLEDENKALAVESGEDDVKLKDLQSEVSSLLSKTKALETEDRLAKNRLKSLLQLKQELEAENLKLSHALISSKEEKTQLIEVRDRGMQEMLASSKRIHQLEEEVALLEQKGQEQAKRFEGECENLHHTLAAAQEVNQRDVTTLEESFEKQFEGLQKRIVDLEEENEGFKEQNAAQTVKLHEFEQQIMEVDAANSQLEQDLLKARELKEALELESSTMVLKIEELQRELEVAQRNKEELLEQIMQREKQASKLQETIGDVQAHRTRLEAEKNEMLKHVLGLEANSKELQKARDSFLAESEHRKLQCKALEASEAQLKEQLASLLNKNNWLQEEKVTLEGMLDKSHSEMKELHCHLSALSSEKSLLLQKASGKANALQTGKDELLQESALQTTHFRDLEVALFRVLEEKDMLEKREAKALHSFSNLEKTSQAESAESKQIVDDHLARIAELELSLTTLIEGRDLLEKQGREALQSNSKLREELGLLETERVEESKVVESLRADGEELKKSKDRLFAECQQFEVESKALKAAEEGLKAQFEAKLAEGVSLQNDKSALEDELANLHLESESRLTRGAELEALLSLLLHEKNVLESKEIEAQKALVLLEKEKSQLTEEVKLKLALTNDLNEGTINLERDRKRLSFDLEQAGQQVVELQEAIANLSNKYAKSQADCQVAEEGARTARLDIERHMSEIQMLQNEINAKVELISKLEDEVTSQSIGLTKLEEKIVLLGNEKEKGIKTMAEYEGKIHDLEIRVTESLAAQTALSGEVAQKLENVRSLEAELVDARKEKETLRDEFSVTAGHAVLLQKQLDKCKELEDAQRVDLHKSADRIQSMEMEVERMQLSLSEAVERNNALICEQQKSLDEITCMGRRIQDLEEQIRHVTEDKVFLVKNNEEQKGKLQMQLQSSNDMNRSLEAELLKLHKAVSTFGEDNSIPVCEQSRSLDASFNMPERIKHIHHKVGGLIEERAVLVREIGSHKEQRNEMELRLQSLGRDKDAVHKELLQALALGQQLRGDMQNLHGEKERLAGMLGVEVMKGENQEKELKRLQEALNSFLLGAKKFADTQREAAEQLSQIEDARKREHEKDVELMELSALAETLKQSLALRDMENSSLLEDLKKSADCQSAAEKRFLDEISYLQSEELKWRNEVSTNSAFMAEKIASLRMEIAALHEELSLKIELGLKLQKDVESLTDECRSLSQALQDMAAEMQDLRDEQYIVKDVVIPSLEERVVELQDETMHLTISNEKHVAEITSLRKQLEDATGELLRLHDENVILKIELMLNVEMLKHVDGVFATAKAEILQLFDKLGLQEKHSQQMLTKATDENGDLSRRLLSVTEERNGLKAEVQCLLAMLVEVEHLRRELAVARGDNCSVRGTESLGSLLSLETRPLNSVGDVESINVQMHNVQPIQNIRGGPEHAQGSVYAHMRQTKPHVLNLEHEKSAFSLELQQQREDSPLTVSGPHDVSKNDGSDLGTAEEGSDGKVEASVSLHAHLIGQLKEEIYFLQEKIQRLELAIPVHGSGIASNEVDARDIGSAAAREDLPSPRMDSTAFSSSILTVEEAVPGRLDDVLKLKEENRNLVEENESLKSQSLAAWTENNLIENSARDLQAKLALLQEKNGHLSSEVSSCKADIDRLEGECHSLQEKNTALQQDVKASIQNKRKSKETLCMLEDVITSLERNNRGLQAENEFASRELKKLHDTLFGLLDGGTELIALLKMKMVTTLEEVKLMIDVCTKEMGDEGIMQLRMNIDPVCSSAHVDVGASVDEDKQGVTIESTNERRVQESMPEPAARSMLILTELQARADEANMLFDVVVFIRKMMFRILGAGEHTCGRGTLLSTMDEALKREEACEVAETTAPLVYDEDLDLVGPAQHRNKLAERLHQAFMDERLEQELLDLKYGRKQLKEELEVRLEEVQRIELELEKLQGLLEEGGERVDREDKKKQKNKKAKESMTELREMLAQQRRQIDRLREEVMFGEEQQEAAAENQVTVLVSMESAPSMEGWDDEQVNVLSRELESLRTLNRRHSAELQTIRQDLHSMGSIIKAAQDQLLLGSPQDGEDEIVSIADLRTQKSNIVDLRAQTSRVSVDSIQHLLSPSPRIGVEGDSVAARRSSSDGSVGQFQLKHRNFGFTWFLLLFSPDRKAAGLARSKSNKRWAAPRTLGRSGSGSGSTALVVERSRRKAASCWACMSNTSRLDSFDQR